MAVDGNILYMGSFDWIMSADISDPLNPVFLDTLDWVENPGEGDDINGIDIHYPYLFAGTRTGVLVVNISNPSYLSRITLFKMFATTLFETTKYWNGYLLVRSSHEIFVLDADRPDSLKVLKINDYGYLGSNIYGVRGNFIDTLLFIEKGLTSFNKSGEISFVKYYPNQFTITGLQTHDSLLILGAYKDIHIYSFNQNFDFKEIGIFASPNGEGDYTCIEVQGNYIYAVCSYGSVFIIDMTDPSIPTFIGQFRNTLWSLFYQVIVRDKYMLIASSYNGVFLVETHLPTNTAEIPPSPSSLSLAPAYPNPFSGSATITYSLPNQEHIALEVYDMLGRKVQTLYNGQRVPGKHTTRLDAGNLPTGVYQVVLKTALGTKSRMVIRR
jgi:hypothetical protein